MSAAFRPANEGMFEGLVGNLWSVAILALIQGEVRGKTTNFYDKKLKTKFAGVLSCKTYQKHD